MMFSNRSGRVAAFLFLAAGSTAAAGTLDGRAALPDGSRLYSGEASPTVLAGASFARGATARDAADRFLAAHGDLLNATGLTPGSLASDGAAERPINADGRGGFRHTVVSFTQSAAGLPVLDAELRLLVRAGPEHAVVLASSTLKPVDGFTVAEGAMERAAVTAAFDAARRSDPALAGADMDAPEFVVFAGEFGRVEAPRLALRFTATAGSPGDAGYARRVLIADAADGTILASRDQVLRADILGTTRGMATEGYRSAFCNPESSTALPFVRISDGTTTVYADAAGSFTLPRANGNAVNLSASLRGRWFRVFSPGTDAPALTMNGVTPPGSAAFLFNAANTTEVRRSEVNAYFHANLTRSQCLAYAPTFPTIGTQQEFRVNVNMSAGTAYYDGSSINFGQSGAGIDSLAMGDVVEHEYGHHLVACAGSGQGPYGEGYGDLMALLNSDSPINGRGYNASNCETGVRTADNAITFPCSNGDPHYCGQLLTGCFWELQQELLASMDLAAAREVTRPLAYNSVLMHQGDQVTPATVTEAVLALDDDDDDVNNGTPHVFEILAGFARHRMEVALPQVTFSFPHGLPPSFSGAHATAVTVRITPGVGRPRPETARILTRTGGGTFTSWPATPEAPGSDLYTAMVGPLPCAQTAEFYAAIDGATRTFSSPADAPATLYQAPVGTVHDRFSDDGSTDTGWTVSGPVVRGAWVRGTPAANGTTGAPRADADGNSACWITGNDGQDVDGSSTILTSPVIDASGPLALLTYRRWYYNSPASGTGSDSMPIEVSGDGGATWQPLETVGPTGADTHGGWVEKTFTLPPEVATPSFRVRFSARDQAPDTTVEAGLDAVSVRVITCDSCPADFNGDNFLDFFDYLDFVTCFEGGACPPGQSADFNRDGFPDFFDYADYLDAFTAGC